MLSFSLVHFLIYVFRKSCNVLPPIWILNDEFKLSLLTLFLIIAFTRFIWINNLSNVALENGAQRQISTINREGFISSSSFLRFKTLLQKSMGIAKLVLKSVEEHWIVWKLSFMSSDVAPFKNGHFFESIKKPLEGCKLGRVLGYFRWIRPNITVKITNSRVMPCKNL